MATLAPPGPSRPARPAPTRTLKQPVALNVAERSAGVVTPQRSSDAAQLRTALERRAGIARRADRWMDKAMEEVLSVPDFQKALSYMHAAQYAEVQHERHLNGLCAYPLCGRAPAAPYRSAKRFVVSTARRTITPKEGNDEEGFCSRKCAARSAWVASSLGTEAAWIRGKVQAIELLEDKEARGEVSWGGRRGDVVVWHKKAEAPIPPAAPEPAPAPPTADARTVPPTANTESRAPAPAAAPAVPAKAPAVPAKAPTPAPAAPAPAPLPTGDMHDLIASLSIVERATPTARPAPPGSAGYIEQGRVLGSATLPLPLPAGGVLSNSPTPTAKDRRAASALLNTGSLASAANTVLAANKSIKPDIDSSDEDSASEEEWAREMGWGRGDEVDALFAQAAEAREML